MRSRGLLALLRLGIEVVEDRPAGAGLVDHAIQSADHDVGPSLIVFGLGDADGSVEIGIGQSRIDDDVAVVGSSNMDIRSFSINMEVSLLVQGAEFVTRLKAVEDDYRAASTELTLDEWLVRPLGGKINDSLARLTASLQ